MVAETAEAVTLAGKFGFTVIVIPALVAGFPAMHGIAFEVITTVTTSLLTSALVVKTLLLIPLFIPFTFHWYDGVVPPFTGVAVKVTAVPVQMVVAEAA